MTTIKSVNPFTNQIVSEYSLETNVANKVAVARESFICWKNFSASKRVECLKDAINYFEINRHQIAKDITEQMGKPLSQANGEIDSFFERANFLFETACEALKDDVLPEKKGINRRIIHEPLGVVFVVAAWNYPLLIAINGVLAALLSGNSVLLKHSSNTLAIGQHFQNAFGEIKECQHLLQNLVLSHQQTDQLITEEKIDHVIFTGSVGGGRKIYESVSKTFMDCQLELGGKDGAYIAADADLDHAAGSMVDGSMYNAGQSCCGIERVYVHEDIYDDFVEKCATLINAYTLGDPKNEATTMGPLSSPQATTEMEEQIADALEKGAKIVTGGKQSKIGEAVFFEPTLLVDVNHSMEVMQEENFGPILPIMKVTDADQAIALINDNQYGLTAAVFTKDEAKAQGWANQLEAGTIFMNRCDYLDPALAWTGYKNSGKGSGLSKYCFHSLTKLKSIHFRTEI
ncbi:MAG: aldehyde dehydrogenase [Planctomycetota bacterium]|nr:MAG: aldehyde dehydrogenase [Planctomycetota bacterium]